MCTLILLLLPLEMPSCLSYLLLLICLYLILVVLMYSPNGCSALLVQSLSSQPKSETYGVRLNHILMIVLS